MVKDKRLWIVIVLALVILSSGYELTAWSWSLHIGEEVCAGSLVTTGTGAQYTVEYGFVVSSDGFQMEQFRQGSATYLTPIPISSIRSLDYDSCELELPQNECEVASDCSCDSGTPTCGYVYGTDKKVCGCLPEPPPECSIASDCGTPPPCEDNCWYECESGDCVLKHGFDISLLLIPLVGLGAAVIIYLKWIKK